MIKRWTVPGLDLPSCRTSIQVNRDQFLLTNTLINNKTTTMQTLTLTKTITTPTHLLTSRAPKDPNPTATNTLASNRKTAITMPLILMISNPSTRSGTNVILRSQPKKSQRSSHPIKRPSLQLQQSLNTRRKSTPPNPPPPPRQHNLSSSSS